MSAPRWAVGMRMIGPGVYLDAGNNLHLCLAEICENAGVPPTPGNLRTLAEAAKRTARDDFGDDTEVTEAER